MADGSLRPRVLKVRFSVEFEATVKVEPSQTPSDAIADIDVPENAQCVYRSGTFTPLGAYDVVTDEPVDVDSDEADDEE